MRNVWKTNPADDDVAALFAESLMMLRPWDQWASDGTIQPGTKEVLAVLESVIARTPNHPLANHLYIHAVESSPDPGRALPSADRLRTLVPGAGHLVHMPGHIDLRLGHYKEAIETNQRGVAADLAYVEQVGRVGFYSVYRAHNYHFLVYAAMFDGQSKVAMQAARDLTREMPLEVVRELPDALDGFIATPYHVMIRFGWWQQILDEPLPPPDLKVTTAFARYSRTIALAALGRVDEAAKELEAFEKSTTEVPESAYIGNNTALTVLGIARRMAKGELAYRQGNVDEGFDHLRDAVRQDDALRYDEPWGWFQPVRHALGALLLEQGRVAEAEEIYRKDLELHPGNGWALHGLAECLRKSGDVEEAARLEEQLRATWARADVTINASCFCRRS
jgi:tetratricopeptide (TPR) repeat protein